MNRIAIYDMDKTITRRPTFTPFLLHAARTLQPWRSILAPFAIVTILLYALRLIDRGRLKELNHALLIGGRLSPADSTRLAKSFAAQMLSTNVLQGAHDRIAEDKAQGYRLVLATASYAFYAGEIGRALGFDEIVGTRTRSDAAGAVLAKIDGENCYGPAKLRMIEAWMEDDGLTRGDCTIRFYSDHVSDAPVLEWADEAFAVNAHAPLAALARERRWALLNWR